jgi:Tol biopolymer transport system component
MRRGRLARAATHGPAAAVKRDRGLEPGNHQYLTPMNPNLARLRRDAWPRLSARAGAAALALASLLAATRDESSAGDEDRFLSQPRQVTFDGRRSGEGYFSPDGKALVFQSEREPDNPFYQIYLLDLETGDSRRLSPGAGKTTCAFFRPRSDEVLFASTHLDPQASAKQRAELEFRAAGKQRRYAWDYDDTMDLFAVRRDGSGLSQLTRAPGYDAEGAYSPDGTKIVFCSLRDAYPLESLTPEQRRQFETDPAAFGEIYLMDADGGNVRRLTATPGYDGGPFFAPDGQRIVWRRFDASGALADIYTMNLEGGDACRLTDFSAMSWAPFFHPSGAYVIFASNKLGFENFELYLVDAAGEREPVRVTFRDGFDGLPVFSPDGLRLCWTSTRGAQQQSQLFLADWNESAARTALQAAPRRAVNTRTRADTRASSVPLPAPAAVPGSNPAPDLGPLALSEEIRAQDLGAHVRYLASDALEGRLTGSRGCLHAADYIAAALKAAGAQPLGSGTDYFQGFEFSAGVNVLAHGTSLVVESMDAAPANFVVERDVRPLAFTESGSVEGEVVFVGYGLTMPGAGGEAYDAYAGVNVSNKVVLALRYVPEAVDAKRRAELNRYAGLRYKALLARTHGAKALLVVSGPASPNAGQLVGLSSDGSLSGSGIVAASITTNVAQALLAPGGRSLAQLQAALDSENPHAESGFVLPRVRVRLAAQVERVRQSDRNVLGVVPPAAGGPGAEYVLLGAHYDHLGRGETGGFGIKDEEGQVHNGADDNASGVAALLELAAAVAAERRSRPESFQRGVAFAFWSGEEMGLLGSSHFAAHPPLPLTNVTAYLNFDMVGRLRDNKLILQGVASAAGWKRLIERRNISAGFDLSLQDDPYLPTDTTAIYPAGIPVLAFFTGSHEQYHRPTDDADTLNFEGLERVTRFARSLALDLAHETARLEYVNVERSRGAGGGRETLRAYLGTVPDYAAELKGVKLSGVRAGSPADKAGLKGGDVIVEFGGQTIANIYDYTYALDAVKIGQPVTIGVTRGADRLTLSVTPEPRK